jgi:hypothetical protein
VPTINIYPDCPKPDWVEIGAKCFCLGEAFDEFTITAIYDKAVSLIRLDGYCQGTESFTKIYQNMDELETRRGWK